MNFTLNSFSFFHRKLLNPLGAKPTKWSNTLKQFVGSLATNCLSVFDHFVKLMLKVLKELYTLVKNCCVIEE